MLTLALEQVSLLYSVQVAVQRRIGAYLFSSRLGSQEDYEQVPNETLGGTVYA
jgi:hypothetical protein